jgi:uncharacterized protein YgiM (DUF1202 family)
MNEGTQILFVAMLGILISLSILILGWLMEINKKLHSIDVRTSYVVEHIANIRKDTDTLGKVLSIYENETKILQKKKAETQLKQRFTRTPR